MPEIQSTVRWLCKRLKNPDMKSWRQLVKLTRYMKGSRGLSTFFPAQGEVTHIAGFLDGDWACDEIDRKSVSGGLAMVAGCRMHNHSRSTGDHALSSGESEIMAASEMLKECLLLQYNLEFAGFGLLKIILYTDATVCRQFAHRVGVGRMKHLDVRYCWLQAEMAKGSYAMKKCSRELNPSDMLTHAPSAAELAKFLPMIGRFPQETSKGPMELVKAALVTRPASGVKLAAALLACMAEGADTQACPVAIPLKQAESENSVGMAWIVVILFVAMLILAFGFWAGWKVRGLVERAPTTVPVVAPVARPIVAPAERATKSTQAPTRYTWWTREPRFVPLAEREHGCWELAR
jgi:hypothetical protein